MTFTANTILTADGLNSELAAKADASNVVNSVAGFTGIVTGLQIASAIPGTAPTGAAGGGLAGTYPNPTVSAVPASALPAMTGDVTATIGTHATTLAAGSATVLNSGTLPAARLPAMTGDVTATGGTHATTLATVNANVGSFGDATHVAAVTVNGKGLVTAASSVLTAWSTTAVTSLGNGLVIAGGALSADTQGNNITATATGTVSPTGVQSVVVTTGANNTTLTVSPGYVGQHLRVELKQGGTARTVAFDTTVEFSTDVPSYTATAIAAARDLIQLICRDGTHWMVAAINKGFAA